MLILNREYKREYIYIDNYQIFDRLFFYRKNWEKSKLKFVQKDKINKKARKNIINLREWEAGSKKIVEIQTEIQRILLSFIFIE